MAPPALSPAKSAANPATTFVVVNMGMLDDEDYGSELSGS